MFIGKHWQNWTIWVWSNCRPPTRRKKMKSSRCCWWAKTMCLIARKLIRRHSSTKCCSKPRLNLRLSFRLRARMYRFALETTERTIIYTTLVCTSKLGALCRGRNALMTFNRRWCLESVITTLRTNSVWKVFLSLIVYLLTSNNSTSAKKRSKS